MGFFDIMTPKISDPVRMAPYQPVDLSEYSDRDLLELQVQTMLETKHTINQILLTAQSSPLLASFLPKP